MSTAPIQNHDCKCLLDEQCTPVRPLNGQLLSRSHGVVEWLMSGCVCCTATDGVSMVADSIRSPRDAACDCDAMAMVMWRW
jgi:G3E family GTPase